MRVLRLPRSAELRNRALLACRDEDRVIAEALAPARLVCDGAADGAPAAEDVPLGRDRDELRHVPRRTVSDAVELAEQHCDRRGAFGGVPPGVDSRSAAKGSAFAPRLTPRRP